MIGKNGRFIKNEDEGLKVNFSLPSMKKIICSVLLFVIILGQMEILSKMKIFQKILTLWNPLCLSIKNNLKVQKKMDYLGKFNI